MENRIEKDEQFFLEKITESLIHTKFCQPEEVVTRLNKVTQTRPDEDLTLSELSEIIAYIHTAGCLPIKIMRAHKLAYCKAVIDEFKKIVIESTPDFQPFELFEEHMMNSHLNKETNYSR